MKYFNRLVFAITTLVLVSFSKETRLVSFKENNEKIEANILTGSKKTKSKEHLTYYWYKNRKVYATQGNYAGELLHGNYKRFFSTGELKVLGEFKKGVKHGNWFYYNKKGNIKNKENWRKGTLLNEVKKQKTAFKLKNLFKRNQKESTITPKDTTLIKDTIQ